MPLNLHSWLSQAYIVEFILMIPWLQVGQSHNSASSSDEVDSPPPINSTVPFSSILILAV